MLPLLCWQNQSAFGVSETRKDKPAGWLRRLIHNLEGAKRGGKDFFIFSSRNLLKKLDFEKINASKR